MGVVGEYLAAFDFQLYLQKRHGVAPNVAKQFYVGRSEIQGFFEGLKHQGLNDKVKIDFDAVLASGFDDLRIERGRIVVERDGRVPLEMRLSPQQMMVYAAADPRDSYGILFSRKSGKEGFELPNGRRFALVYPVGSRLNDERYQSYAVNSIKLKNPVPVNSKNAKPAQRLLNAISRRVNDSVVDKLRNIYRDADFSSRPVVQLGVPPKTPLKERIFYSVSKDKGGRQAVVTFGVDPFGDAIKLPRKAGLERNTSLLLSGKLPYPYYVSSSEENGILYVSILVDLPE